jgi:hypothetical protein
VLVHDANRPSISNTYGGANWYRLTPDTHGDYRNGTWSSAMAMAGQRKYFASGVLMDGRVFVVGGEYSDILGDTDTSSDNDTRAEIFDPVAGSWSTLNKPSPGFDFIVGDVVSCVLEDGRAIFGAIRSARNAIWDPLTDTWTESGTKFGTVANTKVGSTNEESWCLLPNGNVLAVMIASTTATRNAEMYVPSRDEWVSAGVTSSTLPVGTIGTTTLNEIGAAVTLMNGKAFFVGGSGHTGVYTSGATVTAKGSWAAGPDLPADAGNTNAPAGLQTSLDGAAVVLPNGHVLVTSGPVDPSGQFFSGPVTICDVNATGTSLTTQPNQPSSPPGHTWQCCFLVLPNGHVLMSGEQNTINEYVPDAAELTPQASWRPAITGAPSALITGHSYQISGTQLNGLTQANGYGDDRQNASNYPIARLTNSGGDVHYLRTSEFSTMGIATGTATVTTVAEMPSNVPAGAWNLEVVANGIASAAQPVSVGTRDCFLVMDRSTVGHGEVQALIALNGAPAEIDPAIFVVVEGYTAAELGLTTANLGSPPIVPTFPDPIGGLHVVQRGAVLPEDPSMPPNVPQRFTFPFILRFDSDAMFGFTGPSEDLTATAILTAAGQTVANAGVLQLLASPDPYILDGDSAGLDWFTSIDMRVFQVTEGGHRFGATLATTGAAADVATTFIQAVLANLNSPSHPTLASEFDAIDPNEAPEALTLAPVDGSGHRVFNFALARVRLRDLNTDATNVRAFFRMWPAQQTNAVHDPTTLYRTFTAGTRHIPLLGRQGDQIMTIPFFAEKRVNSATVSMTTQTDAPNVRTIHHDSLGAETVGFFGCWLDINQPTDLRFPGRLIGSIPANLPDGPFQGTPPLLSIQQQVKSLHQCLICELNLDGITIPNTADPSTSDKLAQRNLTFVNIPNPGVADSRIAPQTVQIRPTPAAPLDGRPDELMIDWGNVPAGARATIYLPTVDAAAALDWAHAMYVSNRLTLVDGHTLGCEAGGVTYVPVPGAGDIDHAGLIAVALPATVVKGERYSVRVRQITGARFGAGQQVEVGQKVGRKQGDVNVAIGAAAPATVMKSFLEQSRKGFLYRRTIGAFGVEIPVSTRAVLLPIEERTLSILRHIEQTVPIESIWWPVFRRYVDLYAGRVAGMGGDPTIIVATGDGDWKHPWKWCEGHRPHHGHDHDDDSTDDAGHGAVATVTGKVVSLRYDHFGDFTGFVIETEHDAHVVVHSGERRVEHLAHEAWVGRAVVRVRLLAGDRVDSLAVAGQVDE